MITEKLHQELMAKDQQIADLKQLLRSSGLVGKEESHGLIPSRGRPPSRTEPKRARREAQAECVLRLAKVIQGPDLASNMAALVDVAVREDPSVRNCLLETGCLPTVTTQKPDARFSCGYRGDRSTKIVPTRNAAIYQASTGATAASIKALRELGGDKLIDTPEALREWMEWQPELPPIKFVKEGCSAVHVPLDHLLEKLMCNPRITSTIRWVAPYNRGGKLVVWYMVSILPVAFASDVVEIYLKLELDVKLFFVCLKFICY